MKIKFTLVDWIIVILLICAVAFAFVHITSDDSSSVEKTAFEGSTLNKISEKYLSYYKDGLIVTSTVNGFNSTSGEEVSQRGTIIWEDDDGGSDVKILLKTENGTYMLGTYKNTPNADIYIDTLSLEVDGKKYSNLTEVVLKGRNITSLNDLVSNIPNNTDFEITTRLTIDSLDYNKAQEISNIIDSNDKRFAIKTTNQENEKQLVIVRANNNTIGYGDSVLGDFNGISDEITIRIYNCSDSQLNAIKNNSDVLKIRKF